MKATTNPVKLKVLKATTMKTKLGASRICVSETGRAVAAARSAEVPQAERTKGPLNSCGAPEMMMTMMTVTAGGLDDAGRLVLKGETADGAAVLITIGDDAACDLVHILPLALGQRVTAESRVVGSA